MNTVPPAPRNGQGPYRHPIPVHVEPGTPDAFVLAAVNDAEHPTVDADQDLFEDSNERFEALLRSRQARSAAPGRRGSPPASAPPARVGRPFQGDPRLSAAPAAPTLVGRDPRFAQRRLPRDARSPLMGPPEQESDPYGVPGASQEPEPVPTPRNEDVIRLSFLLPGFGRLESGYQAVIRHHDQLILVRNPQSAAASFLPESCGQELRVVFPDQVILLVQTTGYLFPLYGLDVCILQILQDEGPDLSDLQQAMNDGPSPLAEETPSPSQPEG